MSITMLDFNSTQVANYRNLKVWAARGFIHIEDTRTGDYKSIDIRSAGHRLMAQSAMVKHATKMLRSGEKDANKVLDRQKVEDLQRFIEQAHILCLKAQEQGTPWDQSAVNDLKRRRPLTLVMPGAKTKL